MIYRYYAETGGWRLTVLFHEGRKWMKLLDASTLQVYRIAREQHRQLVPYTGIKPRTLARLLRQRRARLKRCNVRFSKQATGRAIGNLETCASGKDSNSKPSTYNV